MLDPDADGARPVTGAETADGFHARLAAALPRLRAHALALTRDRAEADDLVQNAVALALRNRGEFEPGTDFAAWSHGIVRNRHIGSARQRRRQAGSRGAAGGGADRALLPRDDRPDLQELARMLERLPPLLREALLLTATQGWSHEEVAAAQGCAPGAAESRVSRARRLLRLWLLGAPDAASANAADDRAPAPSRALAS